MSALIRSVALVWIGVVAVMIGLIYLAMWALYGHGEVVAMLDGFDIIGYVGLAVIFAPPVIILLVSFWMDLARRF
jgi:hypothetical protein